MEIDLNPKELDKLPYIAEEFMQAFKFEGAMHDLAKSGEGMIDLGPSCSFAIEFRKRSNFVAMRLIVKPKGYSGKKGVVSNVAFQRKAKVKSGNKGTEVSEETFDL